MLSRESTQDQVRLTYQSIGLDELHYLQVREGLAYWQSLCGNRAYPARQQIEPRAICRLLCNTIVIKVIDGGADFEFAIVGDEVTRAYRAPLMRRRLSEVAADLPHSAEYWGSVYRDICTNRQPRAVRFSSGFDGEARFADAEAVLLPLGPNDETVDHIITFAKRTLRSA